MPSATPEALRAACRSFYAGQADAHVEFLDADVVAVDRSGAPDAGTHRGLRDYLRVLTHGAGVPVDLTIGHVMQLRAGRIVTIDAFIDEQVARDFACA